MENEATSPAGFWVEKGRVRGADGKTLIYSGREQKGG